ncbi:hypothetical protein, partial [uncultured Corynebacterium sp.]
PYITGRDTLYLAWSIIRPSLLALSLLLNDGPLLIALAITQLISAATFVPLVLLPPVNETESTTRGRHRRHERTPS